MAGYEDWAAAAETTLKAEARVNPLNPPIRDDAVFDETELMNARLNPECIVEDYLYAQVATLIAPGGAGKTTLIIYEAIQIALGGEVWGNKVMNPGWTLFVTAEDDRETFAARQREIMAQMELSDIARRKALKSIGVWDLTGAGAKLVRADNGNIEPTDLADRIIAAYKNDPPKVIYFDPMVSFGCSEQAVNDNEQAIIVAARRIMRALGCCVRLVHHTGKANARAATTDQYSGRGGSAMADGCRMVAVLAPSEPPPGIPWNPDSSYMKLVRAKLSYCKPQPDIIIEREGYRYRHYIEHGQDEEMRMGAIANQVWTFVDQQLRLGNKHTARSLEGVKDALSLKREEIRWAIERLILDGRMMELDLPKHEIRGQKKTYLCTISEQDR